MYYNRQNEIINVEIWGIENVLLKDILRIFQVTIRNKTWGDNPCHLLILANAGDPQTFLDKCQELFPQGETPLQDYGRPAFYVPLFYTREKCQNHHIHAL